MDGQPPIVTNQDDKDAPADLVVLTLKPSEVYSHQRGLLLELDWYAPDPAAHPGEQATILVRWGPLRNHCYCTPQAPADHGLDPLKAVEFVPRNRRVIDQTRDAFAIT